MVPSDTKVCSGFLPKKGKLKWVGIYLLGESCLALMVMPTCHLLGLPSWKLSLAISNILLLIPTSLRNL